MSQPLKRYQKLIYISIIMIALGVNFNTTLSGDLGSLGTVFIAIGGLFFISAMARKKEEENAEKK